MQDFTTLNLPKALADALTKMNFNTPTPIQAQSIPHSLEGKDILGSAQTGTGKTGAFGIPLIAHLLNNPRGTALVMTPTRELAVQVMVALKQMLANSPQIKTAVLIGGEPMPKQFNQLKMRPRLIVGTPGRINDHLARGTVQLNEANFLVLDETDRMLDMGFGIQIDKILKFMPRQRQTLMFSATLPPYIIKMSKDYMKDPVRVSAGEVSAPVMKIEQETIKINSGDKYARLTEELNNRSGSIIVFVKSKHGADKLAYRLSKDDHEADAIHGDLRQNKRDKVIKSFREGKYRVLVATDIAARGLDIPHIEHVINFDLPQVAEDYVHRIGRTGRNGAEGKALNFVSSEDGAKWKAIQRLINPGEKPQREDDGRPPQHFASRREKPAGKRTPFRQGEGRGGEQRDYSNASGGFRANREKRFGGGNRSDAPRGVQRSEFRSERFERSDRPAHSDRPRSDAPRGDFRSDRPARSDRPRSDRPRSDAPPGNRGGNSEKPRFEKRRDEGGKKRGNSGFKSNAPRGRGRSQRAA